MSRDIYQDATDRIIAQLEQGVIPWQSPYFSKVGFPMNFASGKRYSGINVFLLGGLRYNSPYFLTYKQALELAGMSVKVSMAPSSSNTGPTADRWRRKQMLRI